LCHTRYESIANSNASGYEKFTKVAGIYCTMAIFTTKLSHNDTNIDLNSVKV